MNEVIILMLLGIVCIIIPLNVKFKDKRNGYFILSCGIGIIVSIVIIGILHLYSLYPLWIWSW